MLIAVVSLETWALKLCGTSEEYINIAVWTWWLVNCNVPDVRIRNIKQLRRGFSVVSTIVHWNTFSS